MNKDIIRMAREAGFPIPNVPAHELEAALLTVVERFAQLVAAKCAQIADTAEPYQSADLIRKHFGVEE